MFYDERTPDRKPEKTTDRKPVKFPQTLQAQESQRWFIYAKKANFDRLGYENNISNIAARIMINRDIPEEDFAKFLGGSFMDLHDAHEMMDMDLAVDIIEDALKHHKRIRVVGDYDVDGVCATFILVKALERLGADVDWVIPDRVKDGYGINLRIIDRALEEEIDLIVTCDNGIAALEAINDAVEHGLQVVITDHHEAPAVLPEADAIVDPKQPGDRYPFKDICGAAVAFKMVQFLYEHAGVPAEEWRAFADFAAIATVCDVMPLLDENRIIVKNGIEAIKRTGNIGLNELIDACGIKRESISCYTLGFVIGPCINAGGRLETAGIAMELFLTRDRRDAHDMAAHLKELNDERKYLTESQGNIARKIVEDESAEKGCIDDVLVVYLPECHESIAGIIAGRLKEHFHHPAIVLTPSESEPDMVKGSARSIEQYNIYEKLTSVSDLLVKFGGHKLAAGMTLRYDDIGDFRSRLNSESGLNAEDFEEKIWIDVALPFEMAAERLMDDLERLAPFGTAFEKPVFAQKDVEILSAKLVPGYRNIVKLRLRDRYGFAADGVMFGDGDEILKALAQRATIDVLYYPKPDVFRGVKRVRVQIKAWK